MKDEKMAERIARDVMADYGDVKMTFFQNVNDFFDLGNGVDVLTMVLVQEAIQEAVDKVVNKYDSRMSGEVLKFLKKDRKLTSHLNEIGAEFKR